MGKQTPSPYQPSPPGAQRLQSVTEPPPWPRPSEPCPPPPSRSPAPAGAPRGGEGRPRQECTAGGRRTQEANGGTCKGTSLEQPPSAQAEPSGASWRARSQCAAGLSGRKAAGGTGQWRTGAARAVRKSGGGPERGLRAPNGRRWPEDCAAGARRSRGAGGRESGQPAPGARIRRGPAGKGAAPTAAYSLPGTSGRP